MLLTAQFLDRGLALLIPLRVAHMPGVEAIAATSGLIVSMAAVAATLSANLAAHLSQGYRSGGSSRSDFSPAACSAAHGVRRGLGLAARPSS